MALGNTSEPQSEVCLEPKAKPCSVALVGAGPGDPELLTLKAVDRLNRADVVIHDSLAAPHILPLHAPQARAIDAGKHRGSAMMSQAEINEHIVSFARAGARVVRLKGGDPCIFGRAQEECQALRNAGIDFEIVPGVSSLSAVPASAGIVVTDRDVGRSLGAFSLHKRDGQLPGDDEWRRMATSADTLVMFMGRSVIDEACEKLVRFGRDESTPAALIVNGTRPTQRVLFGTLRSLARASADLTENGPGLIVLGEVVRKAPGFTD